MGLFQRLFSRRRRKKRPNVIVDFLVHEQGFYLNILNASDQGACDVCTLFDRPLRGQHASRNLADLPLLQNIPYLAPNKSITLFIDPLEVFFHFLQENKISIEVHYQNRKGKKYVEKNQHDLSIYANLPPQSRVDFATEI